jgi:hypothetical protein
VMNDDHWMVDMVRWIVGEQDRPCS